MITATVASRTADAQLSMGILSRIMVESVRDGYQLRGGGVSSLQTDLEYISALDEAGREEFLELANTHHVTVRALDVLTKGSTLAGMGDLIELFEGVVAAERQRAEHAVSVLYQICDALENHGCKVAVIKSLDHWPDLGSDLDLYTTAHESAVKNVLRSTFGATPVERSWGDRLAHKWNFAVPNLPESVEVHVRYLGQTGEQERMAQRVIRRRVAKTISGYTFLVPAPEERVLISTLQRMYRHFYFRLCDIIDFAILLNDNAIDFVELHEAAQEGGIWPGTATFLFLISEYVASYGGRIDLPTQVLDSVQSKDIRLFFENGFLRVPKIPAAGLYGRQVLTAGMNGDFRAICRLPLLPPLAVSALLALKLTGSDKGVW